MKRLALTIVVGAILAGCTKEAYVRQADRQVEQILSDSEKDTLDYKPQVQTDSTIPPFPPKDAYNKIPVTVLPGPTTSPMEPRRTDPLPGPYGPDSSLSNAPEVPMGVPLGELARAAGRQAYYGPPAPGRPVQRFDLFASIAYAVQHSRSYQDQMDALYLAALDVTLQRHLFEPRPFANISETYTGGQGDVSYHSALTAVANAGVRQKLLYGGEIVAQALVQFVDALDHNVVNGESASLAISGSIPLLRGAGMVNLEPLINSERQVVYQIRAFESYRRSFVVSIASQYFRLLAQQASVRNRMLNINNLANLTERTRALYDANRLPFLEVQRSEQAQLQVESTLIDAQEAYLNALDDFKLAIGMPIEQELDIIPVAMDVEVPHVESSDAVQLGAKYRLDLQTVKDRIDDAQRNVQVAANGLLPDLGLNGKIAAGNEPNSPAAHLNSRTLTYEAGITLDLPVDRVAERNTYRASLITLQQAMRNHEQFRETIASDVRDSLRAIRDAEVSLQIQERGIALAVQRVDLSNEFLKAGRLGNRDVVDAQTSLLDAQDRYESARSTLQIRVLEYLRNTGTLRLDKGGSLGYAMDRGTLLRRGYEPSAPRDDAP